MAQKTKKHEKQEDEKIMEWNLNQTLSPVWIDFFSVTIRNDDRCLLRLFSALPEGIYEQYRVMTHNDNCKSLIDTLCASINYYPTPCTNE